jgi:PIN domain nuclease of toxin-antitoxin system
VPLLLDTHTFLWFIGNDPRLSTTAAGLIADPDTPVRVSVVSAWEIVIKLGTGKLTLDRPLAQLWPESLAANDFEVLDVTSRHVLALEGLPLHHRDPFDRLLIAQALTEGLEIVSADSAFAPYPVHCIWQ